MNKKFVVLLLVLALCTPFVMGASSNWYGKYREQKKMAQKYKKKASYWRAKYYDMKAQEEATYELLLEENSRAGAFEFAVFVANDWLERLGYNGVYPLPDGETNTEAEFNEFMAIYEELLEQGPTPYTEW